MSFKAENLTEQALSPRTMEFVAPEPQTSNDAELKRLKMQNGLLIMSKRVSQYATIAKQVFLGRWKNKV